MHALGSLLARKCGRRKRVDPVNNDNDMIYVFPKDTERPQYTGRATSRGRHALTTLTLQL